MSPTPQRVRPTLSLVSDNDDAPPGVRRTENWSIWMALAQTGDRESYRRLLNEITPYIRRLAARSMSNRADVEEVVQETLMTVHVARNTYDPARPFGPWLVALANRRIVDGLRRSGRTGARESPLDGEYETFSEHGANFHESSAVNRAMHVAIDQLPKGQRDAIRMLKLEEMSLQEAAKSSGLSITALKVASHRAMKNLRKIFEGSDNAT